MHSVFEKFPTLVATFIWLYWNHPFKLNSIFSLLPIRQNTAEFSSFFFFLVGGIDVNSPVEESNKSERVLLLRVKSVQSTSDWRVLVYIHRAAFLFVIKGCYSKADPRNFRKRATETEKLGLTSKLTFFTILFLTGLSSGLSSHCYHLPMWSEQSWLRATWIQKSSKKNISWTL